MSESCASPFCPNRPTDSVAFDTIEYHVCRKHAEEMYAQARETRQRTVIWTKNAQGVDA